MKKIVNPQKFFRHDSIVQKFKLHVYCTIIFNWNNSGVMLIMRRMSTFFHGFERLTIQSRTI